MSSELIYPSQVTLPQILETCTTSSTKHNDVLYQSTKYLEQNRYQRQSVPFKLLVNAQYNDSASINEILRIIENKSFSLTNALTGQFGVYVTEDGIEIDQYKLPVAVKRFMETRVAFDSLDGGLVQFDIQRTLERAGIPVPTPIAATSTLMLTPWINGEYPDMSDPRFVMYRRALERRINDLVVTGEVQSYWKPDFHNNKNYKPLDLENEDPLKKFIAIDPVYVALDFE